MDPEPTNPTSSNIPLQSSQQGNNFLPSKSFSKKSLLLILGILTIGVLAIGTVTYLLFSVKQDAPVPVVTSQPTIIPSFSPFPSSLPSDDEEPILADVDFPITPIDYPTDWPKQLQFPESLVLVEANSGTIFEGAPKVWIAKFRSEKSAAQISEIVVEHFTQLNWEIKQLPVPTEDLFLAVEYNNEQSTGQVTISSDSGGSRIISSVRLE